MKKLFDAINKGDLEIVKKIIERNPVLVNCREKGWRKRDEGESPLRVAIKNCHYDIVCLLIKAGADVNDYTARDHWYISHQAVYTSVLHCIPRYRLQVGTYEDSFKILKYLIEHQMDINLPNENGVNCLFVGVKLSHWMMHSAPNIFESDLVDKLLWNPQFDVQIAYNGFKEIFSLLLMHGANSEIPKYWQEQASLSKTFSTSIKWADNILSLCNGRTDV